MSVIDILLNTDASKIKIPSKEVEIKRLSAEMGQKVVFKCQAIDYEKLDYVQENAVIDRANGLDISMANTHIFTVIEGVKEPNLKNRDLLAKYGVPTAKELLLSNKLLLPGEIQQLYSIIQGLSGYGEGTVEEVKNS